MISNTFTDVKFSYDVCDITERTRTWSLQTLIIESFCHDPAVHFVISVNLPTSPLPEPRGSRWQAPLYLWWPGWSGAMCPRRWGKRKRRDARWQPWRVSQVCVTLRQQTEDNRSHLHTLTNTLNVTIWRCNFRSSLIIHYLACICMLMLFQESQRYWV